MNFFEAIQEMIKLKICVCEGTKYRINGRNLELFTCKNWITCNTDIFILSGMDWEVFVEPDKPLNEKLQDFEQDPGENYFYESDVKKALIKLEKVFKKRTGPMFYDILMGETMKIFGDGLLK